MRVHAVSYADYRFPESRRLRSLGRGLKVSAPRMVAPGLAVQDLRFMDGDVSAVGEIHEFTDDVDFRLMHDARIFNRDLRTHPLVRRDRAAGYTVQEWAGQARAAGVRVLAAFNLSQGHGWDANTLTIYNGRLVMRAKGKRGLTQDESAAPPVPPSGEFWIYGLDRDQKGLFKVNLRPDESLSRAAPVRLGFAGPPLWVRGKSQLAGLRYGRTPLDGLSVNWRTLRQPMAFTVYGMRRGHRVLLQIAGQPQAGRGREPELRQVVAIAKTLGLTDAVLGGTSGDVQRYHAGKKPQVLFANARAGSRFQLATGKASGQRAVGEVLIVAGKKVV